jgi:tetratricopeptide (TPR) repeat protein
LHARRLVERLGGLPLALATAGAYLRRSTFSFERYLQEYEQTWNFDHHWPAKLPEYERTLYTTWEVSYRSLERENDNAAQLLGLLAYFSNRRFWYELFQAGVSEGLPEWLYGVIFSDVAFESAMRTLTDYCFLEVQVLSSSWSMHMCVHDWTIATLDRDQATTEMQYWYAFDCVGALAEEEDWDSLADIGLSDLAAHARRLEHVCRNHSKAIEHVIPSRINRTESIAKLLHQQVQLAAAEKMYVQALDGREAVVGPEHTSTLNTIVNLGILYRDQGNLAKAEEMYVRARKGYEAAVGPEHTSTLNTINNLGNLYQEQGNLAKAEEMYVRALEGYEAAVGPEHTSTLSAVCGLGVLYQAQGNLAKAEEMLLRAQKGYEAAVGPVHTSTLNTIGNLGNLYQAQGNLAKAEEMYVRARKGYEAAVGPEHTSTLDTIYNLGILYQAQGNLSKAEEMLLRAQKGYEAAVGPEHTSTLNTINNLGNLYQEQGNLAKAEEMYVRTLQGYKSAQGNHEARITFLEEQLSTIGTTIGETDPDYRHVFERLSISRPEPSRITSVSRSGGANSQNKGKEPRIDHRKRDILSRMFKR